MTMTLNAYSGTATIGTTEWSMTTNTAGPDVDTNTGVYQPVVDLSAMAAGDIFEWNLYEKAISGGTQRLAQTAQFANAQGTPLWFGPAVFLGNGWDMTLQKVSGTDRSIDWRISKVS